MNAPRSQRGFTLIEIIVVVAIVSILTGIMVPMVYRMWESNQEDMTRQRMQDLKVALVGDPRLIQNGVRTSFGYVGDHGQLPAKEAIDDVMPYLPAGYDPVKFKQDAWGSAIDYEPVADGSGRLTSATLTAIGPDGSLASTTDNIADSELQISTQEVVPLATIQGNLNITFSTAPTATNSYYIGVMVQRKDSSGSVVATSYVCCSGALTTALNASNTQVNYSQSYVCSLNSDAHLPVGIVSISPVLYTDSGCTTAKTGTAPSAIASTISGSSLFTNLLIQNVSP